MRLVSSFPRRRDERGAALITVVVLIVVCFTVVTVVASSTIFGLRRTNADESEVQALAAAEAGRDATLATLQSGQCPSMTYSGAVGTATYQSAVYFAQTPSSTVPAQSSCPPTAGTVSGYVGIASEGAAADGTTKSVFAWYPYGVLTTTPTPSTSSTPTSSPTTTAPPQVEVLGAILEGGSKAVSTKNLVVHHGSVVLAGSYSCNNNSVIEGDLIVPNGSVALSNSCRIDGSVIASGDISLYNETLAVGGDIISTKGSVSIEGSTVKGSVKAYGGVTLNNSVTIGGDVITLGHATSDFTGGDGTMKTIGGSVSIGGALTDLELAHVTGAVTVTGTGVTSVGAQGSTGAVTAKSIALAGTCSKKGCASTPTPTQNVKGLSAPTFATPTQIGYPTWLEVPWQPSSWKSAGWTVQTATSSQCDYQNTPALVTAINSLTVPTVIDGTACTNGINLYGRTLNLKTDVTFIAPGFNAQNLVVNGTGRTFNLIAPDQTSTDMAPTCSGSATFTIYAATLNGPTGMAYSPCTIAIGSVTWSGQIIAGFPDAAGDNPTINYQPVPVPGATASGAGVATITPTPTQSATPTPTTTAPAPSPSTSTSFPPSVYQQTEPTWAPSP